MVHARALCLCLLLLLSCTNGPEEAGSEDCMEDERVRKESGLELVDIECGSGEEAAGGMAATVHYTGRLESGEVFESSRERDGPYEFLLGAGRVISGWDEGVVGMRTGGVRRLTIPPELGYGHSGFPPRIPPDATLIFEVELLDVTSSED
jgi:FKBP-type peptidyl-prolyl cis-trans isomerase